MYTKPSTYLEKEAIKKQSSYTTNVQYRTKCPVLQELLLLN